MALKLLSVPPRCYFSSSLPAPRLSGVPHLGPCLAPRQRLGPGDVARVKGAVLELGTRLKERVLDLGTLPQAGDNVSHREWGLQKVSWAEGQRLGPGGDVLGWALGTSHGLNPSLVPRLGTASPNRGQERGWGTAPGAGNNLRPRDSGSVGGQRPAAGDTPEAGVPFGGTPEDTGGICGGDGCFFWGGVGTDGPRASPLAPSRSPRLDLSRSPPCARAAFKSPPRKKAQIKYYRRLPRRTPGVFCR